jgi:hypothetical protein
VADASERPLQLPRLDPGSVFAGYRIEGVLARGGMGVIYRATDPELDRVVALKIIAPEYADDAGAVARFKAETRAAAALEHPNIVPIHRGGESDGVLYLAMRLVPGTNLREQLDRGRMDLDRVARIVSDVASALDAAHEKGLVHRDVKPGNVLLAGDGDREHVYLTDFGLAKRLAAPAELTRAGAVVGTPDYLAPEQIEGRTLDGRADVYALGCVAYEMLTGRVPFGRPTSMATLWAHLTDPPPLPRAERPELVPAFDTVVARATAKDPDERYATAGELAAALRDAVAQQRASAPAPALHDEAAQATRDETVVTEPARGDPPVRVVPPAAGPAVVRDAGNGSGTRAIIALVAALVAAAAVVAVVLVTSSSDNGAAKGQKISGDLAGVPTNRVTGSGTAVVRLDGNVADVSVDTNGLLDGAPHPMHLHAGGKARCPSASAARPHNGHRTIATLDGAPFYGPAVTALTLRGDTNPKKSLLAFGRYPKAAKIAYERKIDVGPAVASSLRANDVSLVVHGIDYNRNSVYDGTLDRSDLNRSVPGEATAPALCGHLVADKQASASVGSPVYIATLTVHAVAAPALLCTVEDRAKRSG